MNVISTRSIEIAASVAAEPAVRPAVKAWMLKAAERHIRKTRDMLEKIVSKHQIEYEVDRNLHSKKWRLDRKASRALAEKMSAQLSEGTEFWLFDATRNDAYQEFLAESRSVLDWLDAIPESDRHLRRIERMSYGEAAAISVDWHRRLLALTSAAESDDVLEEIDCALEYEDGCRFVELKGPIALIREGHLMGHCVGGRGYVESVQKGATRIFSLRDPSNRPHVTIEVRRAWQRKALCAIQIKGRGNAAPAMNGSWAAYCRAFIVAQGWEVSRDGNLIGLHTIGGKTYDDPDDMLGALLDLVDRKSLRSLRGGSLSRVLGDTSIMGLILRNVARLKDGTRKRLLKLLTPDHDPNFETESVVVQGPDARSIEVRTLVMPSALMEALAAGFFAGLEGEATIAIAPYLGKTVTEMKAKPHHVHKLAMGGLPKGADLLQQVMAFCGLAKQLDDLRKTVTSTRSEVVGELSSAIRRAARAGQTPPAEGGDWARQLAHLDLVSRPAVEKMGLDSRYLVI